MALSLKQIRYFIATAEAGRVSQAAIDLNVSQSAVTAAIQQLESDLGVELFTRRSGGVSLTAEGGRFLLQARNIMAAVNEAVRTPLAVEATLSGRVRIGLSYTVAGYFIPRHYVRFTRSYPGITAELYELTRPAIERGLKGGSLDLGVMLVSNQEDKENVACETLFRSRRRVWVPAEHPFLKAETVTLADVAREPYVMLSVDEAHQTALKYWKAAGLWPNVILQTSSVEAVRSMVAAGMGVTVLSDMVYRPWSLEGQRIETRNLETDVPSMDVGIAWAARREQKPAAKAFHNFMSLTFGSPGHAFAA